MRKTRTNAIFFLAGAASAMMLASLNGCADVNTANDPAFVQAADSFVNKTVGPDFVNYVNNDPSLDAAQKDDRISNVRTFRAAVEQAQAELMALQGP